MKIHRIFHENMLVCLELTGGFIMLKIILKNCIPTMLAFMLASFYGIMDGMFVGRATGDLGLAAINIAWPIQAVITAIGIGIGSGGSILYGQSIGRGDKKRGQTLFMETVVLLLIVGVVTSCTLLFTHSQLLIILGAEGGVYEEAKSYISIVVSGACLQVLGTGLVPLLRNKNMPIHAMAASIIGLFVNLCVNYFLIFVMGMGIQGAGIGTVVAQSVVVLLSLVFLVKVDKEPKTLKINWKKKDFGKICKTGLAPFGLSMAPSLVLIFSNFMCLRYGGAEAVACYAVISYVTFPMQNILFGVGEGVQPLISLYSGAGKKEELKYIKKIGRRMSVTIALIATILCLVCTAQLAEFFGVSGITREYFEIGMRMSSLAFILIAVVKFYTATQNAMGDSKSAIVATYCETLAIAPLFTLILPNFFGLIGVWMAFPFTAVAMVGIVYGRKILKRRKMERVKV